MIALQIPKSDQLSIGGKKLSAKNLSWFDPHPLGNGGINDRTIAIRQLHHCCHAAGTMCDRLLIACIPPGKLT